MENVAAMVQKKFINDFNDWRNTVADFGYVNYTQVLNAKDYGVPQNRKRVFMISIRNDIERQYHFPEPFELRKRLKDILETNVEEKYYLSDTMIKCFENRTAIAKEKGNGFRFNPTDGSECAKTITTCAGNRTDDNFIIEPQDTAKIICLNSKVNGEQPSVDDTNIGFKNPQHRRVYSTAGISPYLICCKGGGLEPKILSEQPRYRIRKLTPRECFRLMDCDDGIIDKIQGAGISNSQQYKLAGNSIVVNVLYHLFGKMFDDELSLF